MDEAHKILAAARRYLGVKAADVISWAIHEDVGEIWLVVYPGPKHKIPLSELAAKKEHKNGPQPSTTI